MAHRSTGKLERHHLDGTRGLDYMERSVFDYAERVSYSRRFRLHGPFRQSGHYIHPIRAWAIIFIILIFIIVVSAKTGLG